MGGELSSILYSSKLVDDDVCKHKLLGTILHWEPKWLKDPKYEKQPPLIFKEGRPIIATSLLYEKFEEYYKTMEPLMLLEFFHALKKDSEEILNKGGGNGCRTSSVIGKVSQSYMKIEVCGEGNFQSFTMEANMMKQNPSSQKVVTYPGRGDLVRLKCQKNQEIFGYIDDVIMDDDNLFIPHSYTVFTRVVEIENSLKLNMKLTPVTMMSQYFRIYRAVIEFPESALFNSVLKPEASDYKISEGNIKEISSLLSEQSLNPTQLEVVAGISKTIGEERKRICLIQGPPGTGKSSVIVNIILQNLERWSVKILICAPSNKAVDEIVLRLLAIKKEHTFQLNIVRVGREDAMDQGVRKISLSALTPHVKRRKARHLQEEMILARADVIASTLTSCFTRRMAEVFSKREARNLPICIVDEAGQATEVTTLIPLMLGVKFLILVGDPKQLPPTIIAQDAKEHGMDLSLFARAQKNFESSLKNPVVMLNVQYRMVEPIARWPNEYFYEGKVTSAAEVTPLPLQHYRVLNHSFHQTKSKHANWGESKMVLNLLVGIINELLEEKTKSMPTIGVITPYREQKQAIIQIMRKLCYCLGVKANQIGRKQEQRQNLSKRLYRSCDSNFQRNQRKLNKSSETDENEENVMKLSDVLRQVRVNTVDGFQGQERDIIIMSCVRSHGIGFLSDPNRLNVSLTRAKHTMILCGNFKTFRKNAMWQSLLANAESREDFINVDDSKMQPEELKKYILKENSKNESTVTKKLDECDIP